MDKLEESYMIKIKSNAMAAGWLSNRLTDDTLDEFNGYILNMNKYIGLLEKISTLGSDYIESSAKQAYNAGAENYEM